MPSSDPRAKRQMNVRLPADLIEEVDERRAIKGQSRDVAVERMLRFALQQAPTVDPTRSST